MMKCNNAGAMQICWGDWGGGDFDNISLIHCFEKANEREHTTTKEFLEAEDLYEFLQTFNQHNPEGHNFQICRFNLGRDKTCDFSQNEKIVRVDNSLSIACNCRCKFCYKIPGNNLISPNQKQTEAFANNEFISKTYLDTFYRLKGKGLIMMRATDNGEPLLFKKELLEFLDGCTNEDLYAFGITTNGELFDREFIDKLNEISIKNNIDLCIQVSLNAFKDETRKVIMQSKRNIEEIKQDIIYANNIAPKFKMIASMVVVEENLDEIESLDNWCRENNVGCVITPAYGTQYEKFGYGKGAFKTYYDKKFEKNN